MPRHLWNGPPARLARSAAALAAACALSAPARAEDRATIELTAPEGALVYVDGAYAGQVPTARALPSGEHRLAVYEAGHVPHEQTLILLPGRHTELAIALEPTAQRVASVVLLALGGAAMAAGVGLGIATLPQLGQPPEQLPRLRVAAAAAAGAGFAVFAAGGVMFVFDAPALPDGAPTLGQGFGAAIRGAF